MVVRCQTIMSLVEKYAPKYLAQEWDNIGLQIGDPSQIVGRLFLSLDINRDVLDEALAFDADMLVVHHTPFFKPLKNLRTDLPGGRLLFAIVKRGMALYTAHTNLDSAQGGVNDILARKLDLQDVKILAHSWRQKLYKLVVFVPSAYSEQVCEAVCRAGAGWIGNYSDCTFRVTGTGTFRPLEGTNPFIGQKGELENVEEIRLETIVPEENVSKVIKAMIKSHPYEEVAYDLYPLMNDGKTAGLGRVGRLSEPQTLAQFMQLVKERLGISKLRYCGDPDKIIEKAAVCGGSGISYLSSAVFEGAQVFLTSDIKYHEAQEGLAQNIALIDAGHYATEKPAVEVLGEYLRAELVNEDIDIKVSQICTDPFCYY